MSGCRTAAMTVLTRKAVCKWKGRCRLLLAAVIAVYAVWPVYMGQEPYDSIENYNYLDQSIEQLNPTQMYVSRGFVYPFLHSINGMAIKLPKQYDKKALYSMNTGLMATGQMLFKYGANGKSITSVLDIIRLFFTPVVFCALCLYAATTGLWRYILSQMPMSFAYLIQTLAFLLVLMASMMIFKEQISPARWIGVLIIALGVIIATRG